MALETATYIDGLNSANPTATDPVADGDNHIRMLKSVLKNTFPNLNAAVSADAAELNKLDGLTTTKTELGYVSGVTSALQTQLNSKAPLDSPSLTGTPTAPTAAVGTNTTQIATTAFVQAEIAADAPTKTGGGASGTWGINISGNAGSANSATVATTATTANAVAAGSIVTSSIADAAVTTNKIADGAITAAKLASGAVGSVLLGTLTTTSGTSHTLSGLNLTGYTWLYIVIDHVSTTSGASNLTLSAVTGPLLTPALGNAGWFLRGNSLINLHTGIYTSTAYTASAGVGGGVATSYGGAAGITTANTSVSIFLANGGSFDAGSIRFYGVR